MCGIIGYVGTKDVLPVLLQGLEKLEYRGYDSAGVAVLANGQIVVEKKAGKLQTLEQYLQNKKINGTIGIGHTRWATHGGVTDLNAHPHGSCDSDLAVIHNGIIENYLKLKSELSHKGHTFLSETDTEVLAHLIEEEYKQITAKNCKLGDTHPLTESVRRALQKVEGGYAIVVMHKTYPDLLVAARMHNPLILGYGKHENLVASDVPALLEYTKHVYDLENGQIAQINANEINISNLKGEKIAFHTREITWDTRQAEKGGYAHFLIKEIHDTPQVLRSVLSGKLADTGINQGPLGLDEVPLEDIKKIILVGCGSAAYACLYGKYFFEKWTHITTEVFFGSEFRYHEPIIDSHTLVIALSQSGETADTLASIAKAKENKPLRIIGIINAIGSSMTRAVDSVCLLQAGPEISVASTKAFSAMITNLALMALFIAQQSTNKNSAQFQLRNLVKELLSLPDLVEQVIKLESDIARISMFYINHQSAYYIGRDINYPSALEGAQKLKELSYIHAEAYPAGELKHGPNAVIYEGFPIVCLAPQGHVYDKMLNNIQEMKARKAQIFALASIGDSSIASLADHVIYLPKTSEEFSVILNTIAMQLFAYYVTLYKGYSIDNPRTLQKSYPMPGEMIEPPKSIDIDKPRNLAKSVTVE